MAKDYREIVLPKNRKISSMMSEVVKEILDRRKAELGVPLSRSIDQAVRLAEKLGWKMPR